MQPADEGFIAMIAPGFDIILSANDIVVEGAAAADQPSAPISSSRKKQLPLTCMLQYEALTASSQLPEFEQIQRAGAAAASDSVTG